MSTHNRPLIRFAFVQDTALDPVESWRRLFDLAAHSRVIPLTTVAPALSADALQVGSTFVARTALGPCGFDDRMTVRLIEPPRSPGDTGVIELAKEGRMLRGPLRVTVEPRVAGARIRWTQTTDVSFVPAVVASVLAPVLSPMVKAGYRRTVKALLSRRG